MSENYDVMMNASWWNQIYEVLKFPNFADISKIFTKVKAVYSGTKSEAIIVSTPFRKFPRKLFEKYWRHQNVRGPVHTLSIPQTFSDQGTLLPNFMPLAPT